MAKTLINADRVLPIDECAPQIRAALQTGTRLVLEAPPGTGKTTRVPLMLLDQDWCVGKILMLEPRRLAARASAARMAATLGEAVGSTVGYRIRLDNKVGPNTRIEVITEGILTRMLQDDPELSGVSAVLFDEFHERSLHADLGLALCLETQTALRDDLRIVVMSATLDGAAVASLMEDCQVIRSQGRMYPVETRFLARPELRNLPQAAAQAVKATLAEVPDGDVLVFLPGQGEIRRTQGLLDHVGAEIVPLYGELTQAEQDRALTPIAGRRKVVLSTAIAETSLTIEGVRVVIDGGFMRIARFDAGSGMTRLVTIPNSKASADQRRGRAGRLGPGICYRLWSEPEDLALAPFTPPEIAQADLAPLVLDLALWGTRADSLMWLDAPPAPALAQASELLQELGALDEAGRITSHGRQMVKIAAHPRLAHMILKAKTLGLGGLACDLAALLGERDILRSGVNLEDRVEILRGLRAGAGDRGGVMRARQAAKDWRGRLSIRGQEGLISQSGLVLAFAYPDRIGKRRSGADPRYALSGGKGAVLDRADPMAGQEFLVAAELDGNKREAKIYLAAPVSRGEIEDAFADQIVERDVLAWDKRDEQVKASRQILLFKLTLSEKPLPKLDPDCAIAAMIDGIRQMGLACLPWTSELDHWRARVRFIARHQEGWPDLSDEGLLAELENWLAPYLTGITKRSHLERLDLSNALRSMLDWEQQKQLDNLAPSHMEVPSGSRVRIDYEPDQPVLAVRLQEMFGLAETPKVMAGRVPLLLHLLSPARRPVQVTMDLASFWANAYKAVKADLKGQYPKHYWPDDPLIAEATARAKPRR